MREELDKYNDYLADIKRIERDIVKLRKEEISLNGSNFAVNGYIRPKGYMTSNIENKVINNADKIERLKIDKSELEAKINYIDSLLNTLKYDERNLLRMYYIEKKNMSIIQSVYKREADSIHKSITTYINKLDKKFKK